jgi:hypothetical protein
MKRILSILFALALVVSFSLVATTPVAAATPIYVDASQPDDTGLGTSWATAKKYIQSGVNIVDTGGTVYVAAGTYTEYILINKSVVVRGPNAGIDPNTGTRVTEAVINWDGTATHQTILIQSSGVTIDGLTLYGPNGAVKDIGAIGLDGSGARANVHVQYNRIFRTAGGTDWNCDGIRMDPPGAQEASIFIEHNRISIGTETLPSGNPGNNGITIADKAARVNYGGTWLLTNPKRVTIRDNYLYGHSKMYIEGLGVLIESNKFLGDWGPIEVRGSRDVTISNNSLVNQTDVGIYAWSPKAGNSGAGLCEDIFIIGNTIQGMKQDTQAFSDMGTAIILGGVKNAAVNNNTLRNNTGSGVVIGGQDYDHFDPSWGLGVGPYQPINNTIHSNNIEGNTLFGVRVDTSVTSGMPFNATYNWWGANDGPGPVGPGSGDTVSANVLFVPWACQPTTGGQAYFTPSAGVIDDLTPVSTPPNPPATFPYGMFTFKITGLSTGQEVTLTIELPGPVPVGTKWWKYHNNTWSPMDIGDDDGDNVITVALKDGRTPDDEDLVSGQITDQGGPASPTVGWETYPVRKMRVLLPWIALLAAIALAASLLMLRHRRTTT